MHSKISNRKPGCVFIPSYRDSSRLIENFDAMPDFSLGVDIYIYDDNDPTEQDESHCLQVLCARNGWIYRKRRRNDRSSDNVRWNDNAIYNRFIWETMTSLSEEYDFVIKMDTDAYIISPIGWHEEFASLLAGRIALAGTPETRWRQDVDRFWELAKKTGYKYCPPDYVSHMQGGIYGLSHGALKKIKEMGFLDGEHTGFGEDGYMSYCCTLLNIDFHTTKR